ncbi:MAG: mismatch-specific DNA-glycosylase, partial [Armatimonadetes bacterium]|nr:mismatch-specific DNA-glycosylase [Armatimonadota bacterium]
MEPRAPLLPDILSHGLDVVFVGAAPSPAAAQCGHYYAGRGNRFWQLLFQSGFTPRQLDATEDREVLRFGIGLTAILPHCISAMNAMLPTPTRDDRMALVAKLERYSPRIICYNGKDVYRMCGSEPDPPWGLLSGRRHGACMYVVHSS